MHSAAHKVSLWLPASLWLESTYRERLFVLVLNELRFLFGRAITRNVRWRMCPSRSSPLWVGRGESNSAPGRGRVTGDWCVVNGDGAGLSAHDEPAADASRRVPDCSAAASLTQSRHIDLGVLDTGATNTSLTMKYLLHFLAILSEHATNHANVRVTRVKT